MENLDPENSLLGSYECLSLRQFVKSAPQDLNLLCRVGTAHHSLWCTISNHQIAEESSRYVATQRTQNGFATLIQPDSKHTPEIPGHQPVGWVEHRETQLQAWVLFSDSLRPQAIAISDYQIPDFPSSLTAHRFL